MKKLLLPIAVLALALAGCSDDPQPVPAGGGADAGTDSGAAGDGTSLDVQIGSDGGDAGECTANCSGRECGDDGCGGTCGTCTGGDSCTAGVCQGGGGGTGLSCPDLIQCINTNECADQACLEMCLAQGTPEAAEALVVLLECITDNCGGITDNDEFAACQQEQCSDEIAICSGAEPPPEPTGDDTCEEILDCIPNCLTLTDAGQQQSCVNDCYADGTPETAAIAQDVLQCFATAFNAGACEVASVDDFYTCIETECPEDYDACYPPPAECGNGTVEGDEECDDGNTEDDDGCSALCTDEGGDPVCGDGTVDEGEECDDGNTDDDDGCSADCKIEPGEDTCGDGVVDDGEDCDDGNNDDGDECPADCLIDEDICGDGTVDESEECDDGNTDDDDGCSALCTLEPACGDGELDESEECDDGNNDDGDGCAADCTLEM